MEVKFNFHCGSRIVSSVNSSFLLAACSVQMSELDGLIGENRTHSTYDVVTSYVERSAFHFPWRFFVYGSKPPTAEPLVEIFRISAAQESRFLIRAKEVCSITTHWATFTRLCAGGDCRWCSGGFERNWRGYIPANAASGRAGLLEITAATFDEWTTAFEAGQITGKIITVSRATRWSGVRPLISTQCDGPQASIVEPDVVFDLLCRVLRLPRKAGFDDRGEWLEAVRLYACAQGPALPVKLHSA